MLTLYSLLDRNKYKIKHPTTTEYLRLFLKDNEGLTMDKHNLIFVDRDTGRKIQNNQIDENIQNIEIIPKLNKTLKEIISGGMASDVILFINLINKYKKNNNQLLSLIEYIKQETGYCDFWVNDILRYMKMIKY